MSNTSNPHAWLGLLKWSLSYTDGTKPSPSKDELNPLSQEDITFLENVMKDGIVDETARINEILNIFISYLENKLETNEAQAEDDDDDKMIDLLWELRDLIGLIDYSKVFVTMGGLPFLIGCISQMSMNVEIRGICLVLLSTLNQNNPFVQCATLELKLPTTSASGETVIDRLLQLYALDDSVQIKSRIIQALSCIIRHNEKGEDDLCTNATFISILHAGLGIDLQEVHENIQKRCLFLLQALLCSDTTSYNRINTFEKCIDSIIHTILVSSNTASLELREITLQFLHTILTQKINVVSSIYESKEILIRHGRNVISSIDGMMDDEEKDRLTVECNLWKDVIEELGKLGPQPTISNVEEEQKEEGESAEPVFMLGAPPTHDTFAQ